MRSTEATWPADPRTRPVARLEGVPTTSIAIVVLWLAASPAPATEWYAASRRGPDAQRRGRPTVAAGCLRKEVRGGPPRGDVVLTYGTNRIAFHPHVRLARAHVLTGDLGAARAELEAAERHDEPATERRIVADLLRASIEKGTRRAPRLRQRSGLARSSKAPSRAREVARLTCAAGEPPARPSRPVTVGCGIGRRMEGE